MAATNMRDYSLTGPEALRSIDRGLVDADWYRTPIDPGTRAQLHARTNGRAAFDAILWITLLAATALLAWSVRDSWWAIPAFALYGALYGGSADSRWHEYGHSTAFRSEWANRLLYYPACFMLMREPTVWRWSHVRHHSDTIVVGRDPEIVFPRPFAIGTWIGNVLGLFAVPAMLRRIVRHARGALDADVASYVPADEHRNVVREARMYHAILAAVIVWCIAATSIFPVLFIGLPTFYGFWLVLFFGTTQHAGLREDVLDHRLNSRTVYMNPIFRFLYLNMNYHVEHHMYPTVPYRNLPALHAEVRHDLPEASSSTLAAYREIFHAARAQRIDPTFELDRVMPEGSGHASFVHAEAAPAENGWVTVCPAAELNPGEIRRLDAGGATYAVCRTSDGSLHAVDGICTHSRVAHLADGALVGDEIECPKHNGRFALSSGEATRAPVSDAVTVYRAVEESGEVRVHIPNLSTREHRADR
jgi:fatty acid desaturase/nitrite reductase/ring-hydroxylating ferredoxin subunit